VRGRPFLGHENGLGSLLDEILEGSPVRVGGEVVDSPVGGGVELESVRLVAGGAGGGHQHLLGVLHQVLKTRLRDYPRSEKTCHKGMDCLLKGTVQRTRYFEFFMPNKTSWGPQTQV